MSGLLRRDSDGHIVRCAICNEVIAWSENCWETKDGEYLCEKHYHRHFKLLKVLKESGEVAEVVGEFLGLREAIKLKWELLNNRSREEIDKITYEIELM